MRCPTFLTRVLPRPARRAGISSLLALLAFLLPAEQTARAAIEPRSADARIELVYSLSDEVISTQDFSLFAWVWAEGFPGETAGIIRRAGVYRLGTDSAGRVVVGLSMRDGTGAASELMLASPAPIATHQWTLIVLSWTRADAKATLWCRSESGAWMKSEASAPGSTISTGSPFVGTEIGSSGTNPAFDGTIGLIALRDHPVADADVEDVWDSRWHSAPFSLNNKGTEGSMNGEAGCVWMVNHAITSSPINGGGNVDPLLLGAEVAGPVRQTNFHVMDRRAQTLPNELLIARWTAAAQGYVYRSIFDEPYAGFFVRQVPLPLAPLPPPPYRSRLSVTARQLAYGPEQLLFVMLSANSRGVKPSDGLGKGGNFSSGFIAINHAQTAGVLNRPASRAQYPWFGFDAVDMAPYSSGNLSNIESSDYARFWTGSSFLPGKGPGRGQWLERGSGVFALKCRPEGLILADQPLQMRVHVLRFPGSCDLEWTPTKGASQGDPGQDVAPWQTLSLNSERWSRTLSQSGGDQIVSDSEIRLAGDHTASIFVGDACALNDKSISIVTSVDYNISAPLKTTLRFEHPMSDPPQFGETLRFGEWSFEQIEYLWPGLDPQDPLVWRGIKLRASTTGLGAVVFAFDGWRPDVNGFVWGTAGWGGNGYRPQIDKSFSSAIPRWMALTGAHVWLQGIASQESQPEVMAEWLALIRGALPEAEVVWIGEMEHESSTLKTWHKYMLDNGSALGVIVLSIVEHERTGVMLDQYLDGLRADGAHLSLRGNVRCAELWTDLLRFAAIDDCYADVDGTGDIGSGDLNVILALFGSTVEPLSPGDINGDGIVDTIDLTGVLVSWGYVCD